MNEKFLNLYWLKIKNSIIFSIIHIILKCLKLNALKEIISLLELGDSDKTLNLKKTRPLWALNFGICYL